MPVERLNMLQQKCFSLFFLRFQMVILKCLLPFGLFHLNIWVCILAGLNMESGFYSYNANLVFCWNSIPIIRLAAVTLAEFVEIKPFPNTLDSTFWCFILHIMYKLPACMPYTITINVKKSFPYIVFSKWSYKIM